MTRKRVNVSDEELLRMNRRGMSHVAIAAALKRKGTPLSKSAIDERFARMAANGAQVRGQRRRSGRGKKKVAAKAATVLPKAKSSSTRARLSSGDLETASVRDLAGADGDDLETSRRRLRKIRLLLDRNEKAAVDGEVAVSVFGALVRLEADLVDRVVAHTPPAPPDPTTDPTNAEEAADCLARFAAAVAAAEETARCQHCGGRPFA